jgi:uncharacterized protein (TIGR00255 family)
MTGYGYKERNDDNFSVSVEIKGYNSRFLDISVNLPAQFSALDLQIRHSIAEYCRRGKIDVNVFFKERGHELSISVNQAAVNAYFSSLVSVFESLQSAKLEFEKNLSVLKSENPNVDAYIDSLSLKNVLEWKWKEPELAEVMAFEGVMEIEKKRESVDYWGEIEPILLAAIAEFDESRVKEGKHTEKDILSHIETLESNVKIISSRIPELELAIKENIKGRFMELLKLDVAKTSSMLIDENRVLAETAILLMKYTISEEISRLSSHLEEFRQETIRNPSPGKKLDFLCQEINREINTIGSKTPIVEVSRAVVNMKDALENIREQLRNIE